MTKQKFAQLCEDSLVPKISELLEVRLEAFRETQQSMAQELTRLADSLDSVVAHFMPDDDQVAEVE